MTEAINTLTSDETTVLQHILAGLTYPAIAKKMKRPYDTVKSWIKNIRDKTGERTKVGLALWASKNLE